MTWAQELEALPTLATGQTADLKYDDGQVRVWLHRTGLADGEDYERPVSIELLREGRWDEWDTVDGDDPCTHHVFIDTDVLDALRESGAPV